MATYRPKDGKKAARDLRKGDELYVIVDVARNVAPYEDGQLLQRYIVTGTHPLLGGAMVGGHSVEGIIQREGPAYTERPAGIRGLWEPAPQVSAPLSKEVRRLDEKELGRLEKQVARDLEDRYGKSKAKKVAERLVADAKAAA